LNGGETCNSLPPHPHFALSFLELTLFRRSPSHFSPFSIVILFVYHCCFFMFFTIFWVISKVLGFFVFLLAVVVWALRACEAHLCRLLRFCSRWVVVVGVVLRSLDALAFGCCAGVLLLLKWRFVFRLCFIVCTFFVYCLYCSVVIYLYCSTWSVIVVTSDLKCCFAVLLVLLTRKGLVGW